MELDPVELEFDDLLRQIDQLTSHLPEEELVVPETDETIGVVVVEPVGGIAQALRSAFRVRGDQQ